VSDERRTIRARLRARPAVTAGVAVVAIGAVAFVLIWFQPQALLFDRVVDEEFPGRDPAAAETPTDEPDEPDAPDASDEPDPPDEVEPPSEPVAVAAGSFASRNRYTVVGDATVFELEDGRRVLRLEDFESTNGPDLYVYLTVADHADPDSELDADIVDLGALRGNVGNQNYDVPEDVDLDVYDTVVIWCLRFTTSFGAADLAAAG
jgi:hypothetical protein